ncbi:MAG TPA: CGNR zinc finger domain-containing protein [Streptosporangiaceae bacterium]
MRDRENDSTLPLAQQFRFDAGSAALNLLATRGFRRSASPVERLTSARRLEDWLAASELPAVAVDDAGLGAARELREAAYAVVAAGVLAPGHAAGAADVGVLGRWSARPLPGPGLRLLPGGAVARQEPAACLDDVLTALARELAACAADRPPALRTCEAGTCGMLYLDESRGHRRRWCSMARCGNAAKVAAYRARASQ